MCQPRPVNRRARAYRMSEGHETMGEGQRRKSTPAGVAAPCGRGLADRTDNDRLMAIMPDATDPSSTCTAPHVDGCPECVINVEAAYLHLSFTDACVAAYRCADCGHLWQTSWGRC